MSKILLENPGFASPQSHSALRMVSEDQALTAARMWDAEMAEKLADVDLMERLERERIQKEKAAGIKPPPYRPEEFPPLATTDDFVDLPWEPPESDAADPEWMEKEREAWEFDALACRGIAIREARAARAAARRPSPARRIRTQARIRARRSPASTRRATSDSGGGDDAGGDPEPPRRASNTLRGGAL